MKTYSGLFLLPLVVVMLCQCNRTSYTTENFPENDYLAFGQGGGYAAALSTHYLLPNGQLFKSEGIEGPKESLSKVSARSAKKLIEQYQDSLLSLKFNEPGNIYYFLQFVSPDTSHQIQWGNSSAATPEAAKALYDQLQLLLPKE